MRNDSTRQANSNNRNIEQARNINRKRPESIVTPICKDLQLF